jgi:Icc-related predicted phosphoesterase
VSEFKLFFATDIHGSDVCWKKFINSAKFFDCQVLVMGGDMTGKMLIPIVDQGGDRFRVRFGGDDRTIRGGDVPRIRKLIADGGYYPYETTPDEVAALMSDRVAVDQLFQAKMTETLERWLQIAEDRLAGTSVQVFLAPANDDPPFVDDVLAQGSGRVENPEGRAVELPAGWSMITCGWSNPTPWDSPRELPEDQLLERIETEVGRLASMERAIFDLHVPPKDSQLDIAALLNPDLSPVMSGGAPVQAGVGSTAVRTAIERHQPPLALHGHIHESRGAARIGRTLCLNPGSEYNDGVLRGAIVTLSEEGVTRHQLLSG